MEERRGSPARWPRYRQASKKSNGQVNEKYVGMTGCTRHHAGWLLSRWGTTVSERQDG